MNQKIFRKFMARYMMNDHIGLFQTITNGTIIPEEETVELLKIIPNLYIIFSNYGVLSVNQEKAIKKLQDNNVRVGVEESKDISADKYTLWLDYGEVKKYNKTEKELQMVLIWERFRKRV